ncbi:hypothetical protein ACHAXA_006103 [Cyclostephanos tholiformis]|uniref:Methyltransferase type 11 domain-containing protein n=1 Tax=Cyclostephanos tholiformis TaxID=382380 RepID=A0ABD3R5A9_9STRA
MFGQIYACAMMIMLIMMIMTRVSSALSTGRRMSHASSLRFIVRPERRGASPTIISSTSNSLSPPSRRASSILLSIDDCDERAATTTFTPRAMDRTIKITSDPTATHQRRRRGFLVSLVTRTAVVASSASVIDFGLLSGLPMPSHASTRDPKTGVLLPSVGEIESSIPKTWNDDDNPFSSGDKSSFSRLDSAPDDVFYSVPRFVEHVDERAVESMTNYVSDRLLRNGDSVLDLCSSWTSHIRPGRGKELGLKRVAGLGMNAMELEANPTLTEWTVMDLNSAKNGGNVIRLPYDDGCFDVVMIQLSVDYLIYPLEVMREASRVLRKDGRIAVLFSNRLFLSKAVGLWTGSDDVDHAYTVGAYLHYCDGGFENIKAEDLSMRRQRGRERMIVGDPLYVVTATKGL